MGVRHFLYCAVFFQIALYESKVKKMQAEQVSIQVENSTLQSQSTSLLSQINQLQVTQSNLETFKRKVTALVTTRI